MKLEKTREGRLKIIRFFISIMLPLSLAQGKETIGLRSHQSTAGTEHEDLYNCGKALSPVKAVMKIPEVQNFPTQPEETLLVRGSHHGQDGFFVINKTGATFYNLARAASARREGGEYQTFSIAFSGKVVKGSCPKPTGFCNFEAGYDLSPKYPEIYSEPVDDVRALHEHMVEKFGVAFRALPSDALTSYSAALATVSSNHQEFGAHWLSESKLKVRHALCECRKIPSLIATIEQITGVNPRITQPRPGSFIDRFGPFGCEALVASMN